MPHTVCFGQTRKVSWQLPISVGGALYSIPSSLVDERVWARSDGDELVIVHADAPEGPREVARHALTTPGRPSIQEQHYPPRLVGHVTVIRHGEASHGQRGRGMRRTRGGRGDRAYPRTQRADPATDQVRR